MRRANESPRGRTAQSRVPASTGPGHRHTRTEGVVDHRHRRPSGSRRRTRSRSTALRPVGSTATSRCSCRGRRAAALAAAGRVRVRVWGTDGSASRRGATRSPSRWASSTPRIGRRRGSRRRSRTRETAGPAPMFRRSFDVADRRIERARLYVTSAGVHQLHLNGSVVGDHVLAPGWTSYDHRLRYQTYDVTARSLTAARTCSAPWSPTAGGAGTSSWDMLPQRLRRPARPARPARDHLRRRHDRRDRSPTSSGAPRPARSCRPTSTTARPTTPARASRLVGPGFDDRRGRRRRVFEPDGRAGSSHRRARRCAASRSCRSARCSPPRPGRRCSTSARTSSAGCASRVNGEAGRSASRCATPRCSRTASSASARCATPRRPTRYTLRGGGAGDVGAALHLPRLPLRRGRRLAGRARPGRRRPPSCSTPTWSAPAGSRARNELLEPAARERRLGHARQLRRRAHRLPAARRAARLDRRHPGLRAHRQLPVRLRRLARLLAARPRRRAASDDGDVPHRRARRPSSSGRARRPAAWGDAATVVPVGALRALRRPGRARARSSTACAPGSTRRRARPATGRLWTGEFQFGDWLDPDRAARTTRGAAKTDADAGRHRLPRPLGRSSSADAAGVLGHDDDAAALRGASPADVRARVPPRVRHAGGRIAERLRRPPTRWRSSSPAADGPGAARARRRPAGRAACASAGYRIATGFVGTPLVCDALDAARRHRDAAYRLLLQTRVPVLAVPGDDGRDHDLGALGQHAARRHDQPGRDDLVQPLRARRGRRLAAPHGRGLAPAGPRVPPAADRAGAPGRASRRRPVPACAAPAPGRLVSLGPGRHRGHRSTWRYRRTRQRRSCCRARTPSRSTSAPAPTTGATPSTESLVARWADCPMRRRRLRG